MRAPAAARPWAIALPMPCDAAGDDGDLAVELTHRSPPRIAENGRRHQDPVLLGVDQRLDLGQERLPVVARLQGRPPLLALVEAVVAPDAGVGRQRPDLRRERADEAAEHLLLDRDALGLVQPHELGQLARVDVVVALLDDDHQRLSYSAHCQVLQLDPVVDAVARSFAPDARLLDAAERRHLGGDEARVDADDPVLERLRDAPGASRGPGCRSRPRDRTACRSRSRPPRRRS